MPSLTHPIDRGLAVRLFALAALLPATWLYQGSSINLPVLFYVGLGLLLLAPLALAGLLRQDVPMAHLRWPFVAVAAYLFVCSASVFWSVVPEVSAPHWWLRFAWVVGFVAFVDLGLRADWRTRARWLLAAASVACAIWGLVEFVGSPRRATGPFMDANNFASICVVGIFLLLPDLLREQRAPRERFALWIALTVLTLAMFVAYSRAIDMIWLAGTAGFIVLVWRRATGRMNLGAYALLGATCYLLAVFLIPDISSRVTGGGDLSTTLDVRRAMTASALEMWRSQPLQGVGIGTFRILYPMYRSTADQVTAGNTPHNDYLLGLVEGGPLLLGLYLLLLTATVWRGTRVAWRLLRGSATGQDVELAAIALAAGALLVHGTVNFVTITLALQFLLGCLTGLQFSRKVGGDAAAESAVAQDAAGAGDRGDAAEGVLSPRLRTLLPVLVLVATLLPFRVLAQDALAYSVFLQQPGMPFAGYLRATSARYLGFAQQLDLLGPPRGLPSLRVATYFEGLAGMTDGERRLAFARRAEEFYALSIENFPANNRVFLAWAKLRLRPWYKDLDQAHALVDQALHVDPTDAMALQALMQVELEQHGKRAAYLAMRKRFLPWSYYCATTRPFVAEPMLVQLRKWAIEYHDTAALTQIDSSLVRAGRVIEAVRTEQALGWRE